MSLTCGVKSASKFDSCQNNLKILYDGPNRALVGRTIFCFLPKFSTNGLPVKSTCSLSKQQVLPDVQASRTWRPPHGGRSPLWSAPEVHRTHETRYKTVNRSCTPGHDREGEGSCSHYPCEGELSPWSECKIQMVSKHELQPVLLRLKGYLTGGTWKLSIPKGKLYCCMVKYFIKDAEITYKGRFVQAASSVTVICDVSS